MRTFVATKNAGKLAEMQAIFAGSALALETYPRYEDVREGATDYLENARLKARALAVQLRETGIAAAVLGDDSGLEVEGLDGRPGVLSARYAGEDATWPERRRRLLEEVRGLPVLARAARFVCVMVLLLPNGREINARGAVAGEIADPQRGDGGFGYDSIFTYPSSGCTFAELTQAQKNAVSHRRRAADALLAALAEDA